MLEIRRVNNARNAARQRHELAVYNGFGHGQVEAAECEPVAAHRLNFEVCVLENFVRGVVGERIVNRCVHIHVDVGGRIECEL